MFKKFTTCFILGWVAMPTVALAAVCTISDANWNINAKGGDPSVRAAIGNPVGDVLMTATSDGCFRTHERGAIYWNKDTGAHFVLGSIRTKWNSLGSERSLLRYPLTDESSTPDGVGRFNHFQGGSIYWNPKIGTFEVHGDIRTLWSQMGWERSSLGYPSTDESRTPDGVGRFNHFQNGSIYWKPNLGPHFVRGSIHDYWAAAGWERNPALGYPISNELAPRAGSPDRHQDFENGVLYWKSRTGKTLELGPLPSASRNRDEVEVDAQGKVATMMLPYADKAYIEQNARITQVAEYTRAGFNGVQNREIKLSLRVKYKASFLGIDGLLPDPYTDLDLWVLISKDKSAAGTDITMTLTHGTMHTTVPAPTNAVISPSTINAKLKSEVIDKVVGVPQLMGHVSPSFNVLSVKVMRDGSLNTYIETL